MAEILVLHALMSTDNDNPHWSTLPRSIRLLNILKANAPFAAFGLFHRRFNKVKAEFENEHDKNQ